MRHSPDALMIFAAGFGTRMGALTGARPKPLIRVAGRTLLDHALDLSTGQGIARTVVNAHYRADQIERHLAGRQGVTVVTEAPDILETGGGLKAALPMLGGGAVFTLNSDAVWTGPNPLASLAAAWDPEQMDCLVLLLPPERATGHTGKGDFDSDDAGVLRRGVSLVYSGAQIVNTARLSDIPDRVFSLNRVWDRLIPAGRLHGVTHTGGWCDVGRPDSLPLAEALLSGAPDV